MDDANNGMAQHQQQQFLLLQQYQQQQQRQHLLQQQQKHLLQQHDQHHHHQHQHLLQQQPQQHHQHIQQQQAISRFPSSIDPHLRASGFRSLQLQQQQQQQSQPQLVNSVHQQPQHHNAHAQPHLLHQPQQQQQVGAAAAAVGSQRNPVEMEMARQDALKVCKPDVKRPFSSLEDAVCRLLPYHVVADYETEEDDRILDNDTTRQIPSRLQQWDHNILTKIAEITTTFENQVLAFNMMSQKRALGEFRSEERLKLEQALLQEEKQTLLQIKGEVKFRENADQEAEAVAKMRMAVVQAEQA